MASKPHATSQTRPRRAASPPPPAACQRNHGQRRFFCCRAGPGAPAAIRMLRLHQPTLACRQHLRCLRSPARRGQRHPRGAQRINHPRGPHDRIPAVLRILVAEPERQPAARRVLFPFQIVRRPPHRGIEAASVPMRDGLVITPGCPRRQRVRADVRTTPVKRQPSPAAAERRHAAVAVLQRQQPAQAGAHGRFQVDCAPLILHPFQRHQRTGRIIGIRHAARQIGPRPPSRRRAGERMTVRGLGRQQPIGDPLQLGTCQPRRTARKNLAGSDHRSRRQRRHPDPQIGVDRPTAGRAHRLTQKRAALLSDRMVAKAGVTQGEANKRGQRNCIQKPAMRRLQPLKAPQQRAAQPKSPRPSAARARRAQMPAQADRNQGRHRITHHLQPEKAVEGLGQQGRRKGKRRNTQPRLHRVVTHREKRQDWHGKGPVIAVHLAQCAHDPLRRRGPAKTRRQPGISPCHSRLARRAARRAAPFQRAQSTQADQARAQV
ncbi:MAG: hypothetical protein BWX70_03284 [Verrucomicrobia bacterium ADurb.Bin070]|nr:MAG: hypothetical protein BWX70_03284 [Verrucomicrobia bacterium ADurb.Bin070]